MDKINVTNRGGWSEKGHKWGGFLFTCRGWVQFKINANVWAQTLPTTYLEDMLFWSVY